MPAVNILFNYDEKGTCLRSAYLLLFFSKIPDAD